MSLRIKSANVFVTKTGEAKLGDLNVSKVAKNGLLYTQTGTPYYASPEVWRDDPYDSKSDIWSLGCVIYEMTTLEPPFQAEDMEGLFKAVTKGEYPSIKTNYSKQLAHIIKLMLQLKPKLRPSTDKILSSNLIKKKIQELHIDFTPITSSKPELLKTIRIPKNLHYLTDRLPKPNYEHHSDLLHPNPATLSPKEKNTSLPKLTHVLRQGLEHLKLDKKKRKYTRLNPLMIEGHSKAIEELKNCSKLTKHIEAQSKIELQNIYIPKGLRPEKIKKNEKSMVLPPIKL